ncbi:DUF6763 family protein [Dasania marina]|uniref:DUF6763 family protein n=1 Tax=Dasania marina TaxID=471499 RepID=UPI00037BED91|nr:DUF6763 family protein [Dasania marina]
MRNIMPSVGNWYKELQGGGIFEVVAVDDISQTIETQHIDGEINEFDLENWHELQLLEVEEPEDWRNAYELSHEDSLDPDAAIRPEEWSSPVSYIETDIMNGVLDDM